MSQPASDPLADLVPGYPRLAGKMGTMPETAMFRAFSTLNARNLLYLQAELISLENQLLRCEAEDSMDAKRKEFAHDWFWLNQSQWEESEPKQYNLVQDIKGKLKEYSIPKLFQQA